MLYNKISICIYNINDNIIRNNANIIRSSEIKTDIRSIFLVIECCNNTTQKHHNAGLDHIEVYLEFITSKHFFYRNKIKVISFRAETRNSISKGNAIGICILRDNIFIFLFCIFNIVEKSIGTAIEDFISRGRRGNFMIL